MHCILFCLTLKTESCTIFHHPFTSANPYQGHWGGVGGGGGGVPVEVGYTPNAANTKATRFWSC